MYSKILVCDPENDGCGENAVCGYSVFGAACERGICMCESPIFAPLFLNATDCGRVLRPGDACTSTEDAAMLIPEFAQCNDGVVECTMDMVPSGAGDQCVAPSSIKSQPGEVCDEDIKCNEAIGLMCSILSDTGRHCQCANNLIFKNNRCEPALYGDPCINDDQCNVIYNELPGATRGICSNSTCVCGEGYMTMSAVVRNSPSSTLMPEMVAKNVLGYYCFSVYLASKMIAPDGANCSVPQPTAQFATKQIYCQDGLVCVHCAESESLSQGKCQNVTLLLQKQSTTMKTTPERTTPVTLSTLEPAKVKGSDDEKTNTGTTVVPGTIIIALISSTILQMCRLSLFEQF